MPSLVEIGPAVLEKYILKFRQCIFPIHYYLLLEKGYPFILKKIDFPLPKDALCQVWLKLAQHFWRRFFNFVNIFSLSRN